MSEVKLNKKGRRLLKNKNKLENLLQRITNITLKCEQLIQNNNKIIMLIKETQKIHPHEVKRIIKETNLQLENLIKSGTRISKHTFNEPLILSQDLHSFLKIEEEKLSRIEVVQKISKYIRDKKLQDPDNRKLFNLDQNLGKLFKIENLDNKYTYTNINKFIQPHLTLS